MFKISRGCRQGGIESPFIFNCVFDTACRVIHWKLIDKLGDSYGFDVSYQIPNQPTDRAQRGRHKQRGDTNVYRVMYADDLCACFKTVEAAQKGLEIMEAEFRRYGLTLSRPKTELLAMNCEPEVTNASSLIKLGADKIKNVLEFKYLGVLLSSTQPTKLIEHRIAAATQKYFEPESGLSRLFKISTKINLVG